MTSSGGAAQLPSSLSSLHSADGFPRSLSQPERDARTAWKRFEVEQERCRSRFARLSELPEWNAGPWHELYNEALQEHGKLWQLKDRHREVLKRAGMTRWQVGEIASRIGQIYYEYYNRTGEARFLREACVWYDTIRKRQYFRPAEPTTGELLQQLRYYMRFTLVCILLDELSKAQQLLTEVQTVLAGLPAGRAQNEWATAHEEAWQCIEALQLVPREAPTADTPCGLDLRLPAPSSPSAVQTAVSDAVVVSYRRGQTKVGVLPVDFIRISQALEWQPAASGSAALGEAPATAPPAPNKILLYRCHATHLASALAATLDALPSGRLLLLFVSADAAPGGGAAAVAAEAARSVFDAAAPGEGGGGATVTARATVAQRAAELAPRGVLLYPTRAPPGAARASEGGGGAGHEHPHVHRNDVGAISGNKGTLSSELMTTLSVSGAAKLPSMRHSRDGGGKDRELLPQLSETEAWQGECTRSHASARLSAECAGDFSPRPPQPRPCSGDSSGGADASPLRQSASSQNGAAAPRLPQRPRSADARPGVASAQQLLLPEDLVGLTRKRLLLLADSDNSGAFTHLCDAALTFAPLLLLSPARLRRCEPPESEVERGERLFTLFLTHPVHALLRFTAQTATPALLARLAALVDTALDDLRERGSGEAPTAAPAAKCSAEVRAAVAAGERPQASPHVQHAAELERPWQTALGCPFASRLVLRFALLRGVLRALVDAGSGGVDVAGWPQAWPPLPAALDEGAEAVRGHADALLAALQQRFPQAQPEGA